MSVLWAPNLQIALQRSPLHMRGKCKCKREAGKTRRYEHPTTWPSFFPPPSPSLACHNVWRRIPKRLEATNLRTENRQNAENTRRKHPCWAAVATNRNGCPAGIKEILRAQSHAVLTESKNRFYLPIRSFVGACPHRDRDYRIRSNFWKFYLIRTGFTLGELVFLAKVFRLFSLEGNFLCSDCGHSM